MQGCAAEVGAAETVTAGNRWSAQTTEDRRQLATVFTGPPPVTHEGKTRDNGGSACNTWLSGFCAMNDTQLIWSYEHDAWWAPNERGYVRDVESAGRYTPEHAAKICARAFPNEVMVPESWAVDHGKPTHHPYHDECVRAVS